MAALSPSLVDLLKGPNFAHLATLNRDGSPQVTPVWVDTDGTHVLVNTSFGRLKERNARRDPRVMLSVLRHDNPYARAFIKGRVLELREEGAGAHIDALARRYIGAERYALPLGERRVVMVIEPERITDQGL